MPRLYQKKYRQAFHTIVQTVDGIFCHSVFITSLIRENYSAKPLMVKQRCHSPTTMKYIGVWFANAFGIDGYQTAVRYNQYTSVRNRIGSCRGLFFVVVDHRLNYQNGRRFITKQYCFAGTSLH